MMDQQTCRQLDAARYVFHRVAAYRVAEAVVRGEVSLEEAHAHYNEAMRNYDGIVENAKLGNSAEANAAEVRKGAVAVSEAVERLR